MTFFTLCEKVKIRKWQPLTWFKDKNLRNTRKVLETKILKLLEILPKLEKFNLLNNNWLSLNPFKCIKQSNAPYR